MGCTFLHIYILEHKRFLAGILWEEFADPDLEQLLKLIMRSSNQKSIDN